jgi:hypothetical protein
MDGSELPDVSVSLTEEDGAAVVPGTTAAPAVEPSDEALAAHTALIEIMLAEQTPGDRIIAVAGVKTQYAAVLDAIIDVDGTTMTIANLADRVAAGAKKESK